LRAGVQPNVKHDQTSTLVRQAMRSVQDGRVFQLAHPLGPNIPHLRDRPSGDGQQFAMWMRVFDLPNLEVKVFADFVSFHTHTGTHIDALAHWSRRGQTFSGLDAEANYTPNGMRRLGIDEVPPLIGRGVLIDIPRYKSVDYLSAGTPILPEDLQGALEAQKQRLRPGDIVVFRTGWSRFWNDPKEYMSGCPGLVEESADWLARQGCVAIGSDQWDIDVVPAASPEKEAAVHALCLADRGIYLIENLALDEIASAGVHEFCFIALVPPVIGATGFPVQVVAVA
jgi:kynurenine formamidase